MKQDLTVGVTGTQGRGGMSLSLQAEGLQVVPSSVSRELRGYSRPMLLPEGTS